MSYDPLAIVSGRQAGAHLGRYSSLIPDRLIFQHTCLSPDWIRHYCQLGRTLNILRSSTS